RADAARGRMWRPRRGAVPDVLSPLLGLASLASGAPRPRGTLMTSQAEFFLRQAADCDGRSPLYARLCRELAEEPLAAEIEPEPRWDLPLRLLGGLHYLHLAEGIDSWSDVR